MDCGSVWWTAVWTAEIAANQVDTGKLAVTGVAAGTYGSAGLVPVFTVTTDGRITGGSSVAVSVAAGRTEEPTSEPHAPDHPTPLLLPDPTKQLTPAPPHT